MVKNTSARQPVSAETEIMMRVIVRGQRRRSTASQLVVLVVRKLCTLKCVAETGGAYCYCSFIPLAETIMFLFGFVTADANQH